LYDVRVAADDFFCFFMIFEKSSYFGLPPTHPSTQIMPGQRQEREISIWGFGFGFIFIFIFLSEKNE